MPKQKKWNLIVGVLVVGAILVLLIDRKDNPVQHDRVGEHLLSDGVAASLTAIEISKGEAKLAISKGENGWQVQEGGMTLPADGSKLANMIDDLRKSKVQRLVQRELKTPESFGLDAPTLVTLGGDTTKTAIRLGSSRTGGGQYLQIGDGKEVFLVSDAVRVPTDLDEWELKVLVSITDTEVKAIAYDPGKGKGAVSVSREDKDKPLVVDGLKEGEKSRDSAVTNLAKALDSFRFTKRVDHSNESAKSALAKPVATVTFTLLDGREYKATIGRIGKDADKKYFVSLVGKAEGDVPGDQKAAISVLNDLGSRFFFEVSNWNAERLLKDRDDLVEKEKKS